MSLHEASYYSYQYLMRPMATPQAAPVGRRYLRQTENKYNVLVYYRAQSDRTDRLVGYGELK